MSFGMMEALLSFMRRQVGLRTDAASASGSLHAKVAEELARMGTKNPTAGGTDTLFKYNKKMFDRLDEVYEPFSYAGSVSVSNSYVSVRNITGEGFLFSAVNISTSSSYSIYTRVTIDGSVVFESYSSTGSERAPSGILYVPGGAQRVSYAYGSANYDGDYRIYDYPVMQFGRNSARLEGTDPSFNPAFPSSSSQRAILLTAIPIRFRSSLKIEHRSGSSSAIGINVAHMGALVKK